MTQAHLESGDLAALKSPLFSKSHQVAFRFHQPQELHLFKNTKIARILTNAAYHTESDPERKKHMQVEDLIRMTFHGLKLELDPENPDLVRVRLVGGSLETILPERLDRRHLEAGKAFDLHLPTQEQSLLGNTVKAQGHIRFPWNPGTQTLSVEKVYAEMTVSPVLSSESRPARCGAENNGVLPLPKKNLAPSGRKPTRPHQPSRSDSSEIPFKTLVRRRFAVSRMSGWMDHVIEQLTNNRLIRPRADYTGVKEAHWVPMNQRT